MNKPFNQIVKSLYDEIVQLNLYLEQDQNILPEQNAKAIEQGHIEKLTARNNIDVLMKSLSDHAEWPLFQAELEARENAAGKVPEGNYSSQIEFWLEIRQQVERSQNLIQINQNIIQSSLSYYTYLFEQIIKTVSDDSSLVYEKELG